MPTSAGVRAGGETQRERVGERERERELGGNLRLDHQPGQRRRGPRQLTNGDRELHRLPSHLAEPEGDDERRRGVQPRIVVQPGVRCRQRAVGRLDIHRQPEREEQLREVIDDPLDVQIAGAPAVDDRRQLLRVTEDEWNLRPVEAHPDERRPIGRRRLMLHPDHVQHQQHAIERGQFEREVVGEQQLWQPLAHFREEGGGVHAGRRGGDPLDRVVHLLRVAQQLRDVVGRWRIAERVQLRDRRLHRRQQRLVLGRQIRDRPAQAVHQLLEVGQIAHAVDERAQRQREVAGDEFERSRGIHGYFCGYTLS